MQFVEEESGVFFAEVGGGRGGELGDEVGELAVVEFSWRGGG